MGVQCLLVEMMGYLQTMMLLCTQPAAGNNSSSPYSRTSVPMATGKPTDVSWRHKLPGDLLLALWTPGLVLSIRETLLAMPTVQGSGL
jgi:hypothetical protein